MRKADDDPQVLKRASHEPMTEEELEESKKYPLTREKWGAPTNPIIIRKASDEPSP